MDRQNKNMNVFFEVSQTVLASVLEILKQDSVLQTDSNSKP